MKSDRERQILYDIIYMQNLKYDTTEFIYKTEINSQTQKTNLQLPKEQEWGEKNEEAGVSICMLLYKNTENHHWPTKVHSKGNSTQYSVISYMGK